ncbi:hypothetical protein LMH73_013855 [Vibrio splendidus]|nr:type II toxin-antitoxin system Phd/YefM family antitoxin [Vibrio splendidus]MCC4883064.1 type II toxin-antitoxin system Phd/YefM family antitoxin [Vibrio splendidus]
MNSIELSNFSGDVDQLDLTEAMLITQDGKPLFVIESHKAFTERLGALLSHELALGELDIKEGRTIDSDEFSAFIDELKNS